MLANTQIIAVKLAEQQLTRAQRVSFPKVSNSTAHLFPQWMSTTRSCSRSRKRTSYHLRTLKVLIGVKIARRESKIKSNQNKKQICAPPHYGVVVLHAIRAFHMKEGFRRRRDSRMVSSICKNAELVRFLLGGTKQRSVWWWWNLEMSRRVTCIDRDLQGYDLEDGDTRKLPLDLISRTNPGTEIRQSANITNTIPYSRHL